MSVARIGIAMNTSQAPCVNFVTVTMSSTKTVIAAPTELMTSPILALRRSRAIVCGEMGVIPGVPGEQPPRPVEWKRRQRSGGVSSRGRAPGRRSSRSARRQCRTMPICPSENDMKTPMM